MESKKKEMSYAVKPSHWIDISDTTATPSEVLSGKAFCGVSYIGESCFSRTNLRQLKIPDDVNE